MKILFYRYGSICEPFILRAFKELGVEVTQINLEITNKNLLPSDCTRAVSDALLKKDYAFVFSINFFPVVSDVCNIFHKIYIGWTVDSPVLELYNNSIKNDCNRIFIFDRADYHAIAPLNPGHIYHLPLASDPLYWEEVTKGADLSTHQKFSCDLSFVGSLYTEKAAYDKIAITSDYLKGYLNAIMEAQLKIYGYYMVEDLLTDAPIKEFIDCIPDYALPISCAALTDRVFIGQHLIGTKITALERSRLLKLLSEKYNVTIYTGSDTAELSHIHNHGFAKTLTEMPVIFNESTINLNFTSKAIRSGIPLRVFDILGCEGFLISNYQPEIPELFVPDEEIVLFGSAEELDELCHYYLDHPKKAAEIAHNAYEKVKNHYTYRQRIEQMMQLILGDNQKGLS